MLNTQVWNTFAVIPETEDVVTIVFDTNNQPFIYQPGQFIDLTLNINGVPVTRSYSLSSVPEEDTRPSITVKRVPGGLMSSFIVNAAAQIGEWKIKGPYGAFTPSAHHYTSDHIVLLAGGSGITPLYAMARSIIRRSEDTRVTLVYSSRTANDIIFRTALESWAEAYQERINVYHVLSRPDDAIDLLDGRPVKERLNRLTARKLIRQALGEAAPHAHYFICGPASLMKMHKETLDGLQVPSENIYMEWFAPEAPDGTVALPEQMQEVLLHFYEQSNLLEVQAGQTILAAALADKISLPYSCRSGTCGACAARLLAGKVVMPGNYALRQSDVDNGVILLCCSYPVTDDVTVELG